VLVSAAACGSPSVGYTPPPIAPSPPPPANPNQWSVQGRVVDTVSGAPVTGATLDLEGFGPVTAGADGAYRFESSIPANTTYRVTVSAPGFITREVMVTWQRGSRTGVDIDIIRDASPFSLDFFRAIVRNGYEEPDDLETLERWTSPPRFYVRTVHEETGMPVDPMVLDYVREWLGIGVTAWTGWSVPAIESGTESRPGQAGWIRVIFIRNTSIVCGRSFVGTNPGTITFNTGNCGCGSRHVPAEVVIHEVGHALGFWHVDDRQSAMFPIIAGGCRAADVSAVERHHAAIAYRRPIGSRDIDIDPSEIGQIRPLGHRQGRHGVEIEN
jgi:hypothetical protein